MILTVVMMTIVIIGIAATLLTQPEHESSFTIWSDDVERRLLRERKTGRGW